MTEPPGDYIEPPYSEEPQMFATLIGSGGGKGRVVPMTLKDAPADDGTKPPPTQHDIERLDAWITGLNAMAEACDLSDLVFTATVDGKVTEIRLPIEGKITIKQTITLGR